MPAPTTRTFGIDGHGGALQRVVERDAPHRGREQQLAFWWRGRVFRDPGHLLPDVDHLVEVRVSRPRPAAPPERRLVHEGEHDATTRCVSLCAARSSLMSCCPGPST